MIQNFAQELIQAFNTSRQYSVDICDPLYIEDYGLQVAAFASPPKWHLAHTTWFYETFILKVYVADYKVFSPHFDVLFNSYYNAVGEQYPRPMRGALSRPSVAEVINYRSYVNDFVNQLLDDPQHPNYQAILARCRLGIEHEKQHQELFFTDLKYSLSKNPMLPAYAQFNAPDAKLGVVDENAEWVECQGGLFDIGLDEQDVDFNFDNESPKHQVYIAPFSLANHLVTNSDFQQFIDDGGYQRPELWLADGWSIVKEQKWNKPLYWCKQDNQAMHFTLAGLQARDADQAVLHLSAYEADAYANWAEARLPTEQEWEVAAVQQSAALKNLYDVCWQWTSSAYRPYPGFRISEGALGEYNGKFMCNQWVLRGGSCVSSSGHLRPTYRNFFYPHDRWQFSGLRLAKSI